MHHGAPPPVERTIDLAVPRPISPRDLPSLSAADGLGGRHHRHTLKTAQYNETILDSQFLKDFSKGRSD